MTSYTLSLAKQTEYSIDGHIYEHVIANKIFHKLASKGYNYFLDYTAECNTYDGIVVFTLEAKNRRLLNEVASVMKQALISREDVQEAVLEVASEYTRRPRIDIDTALAKLNQINTQPWVKTAKFHSRPIIEGAGELKSPIGRFGRKASGDFDSFIFTYAIDGLSHELRPLAVYVIQVLALMQVNYLQRKIPSGYDAGDEWAEYYTDLTAYAHRYVVPKLSKVTKAKVKTIFDEQYGRRNDKQIIHDIKNYILWDLRQPYHYFNIEKMFAFSYQITGSRAMRQDVTDENIKLVISKIKLKIEKEAVK